MVRKEGACNLLDGPEILRYLDSCLLTLEDPSWYCLVLSKLSRGICREKVETILSEGILILTDRPPLNMRITNTVSDRRALSSQCKYNSVAAIATVIVMGRYLDQLQGRCVLLYVYSYKAFYHAAAICRTRA